MVLKIADRGKLPPFIVMDVMKASAEREATGADVLHLEVGQPSTSAPKKVLEAAKLAITNHNLGYTVAFGLPELRERITQHYKLWYGVDISIDRVAVTNGSSAAFILSFMASFNPGDRVAMVAPGYPAYRNILTALGIETIELQANIEHRFQPTVSLLKKIKGNIDGLIIASPSNPTGTMIDKRLMEELADYCDYEGIRLISDEIYHGITYGNTSVSSLEVNPQSLVINSFSKYFSMTGWRLGWMIVPDDLIRPMECLSQNFFISAPTHSQLAAIAAFDSYDDAEENIKRYARNRSILMNELPSAGISSFAPADGAFYIYADISNLTNSSAKFCKDMLDDIGVACTPGLDFDPLRGGSSIRLSFAGTEADIIEACKRLRNWLR